MLGYAVYSINKYAKIAERNNDMLEKCHLYEIKSAVLENLEMVEIHIEIEFKNSNFEISDYLSYYKVAKFSFHDKLEREKALNLIRSGIRTKNISKIKKQNLQELSNLELLEKQKALNVINDFLMKCKLKTG